jgi:hypothetical protein
VLVLHPSLGAGFVLVDDHEILSFSPGARADPDLRPIPDLVTRILVDDAGGGRVRPLYWVIRYSEIAVLGTRAMEWHALYVGLGILSAALFYLALSAANVSGLPAFLASAWLLVVPGVSSVWIRLGPQESLGTVLFLLGAWAAARGALPGSWRGWDWIFAIAISAATLTKESFALVPPAALGLRVLLFGLQQGKRAGFSRRALVPGVAAVVVGLTVAGVAFNVARLSRAGSYGGGFLSTAALSFDATTLINLAVLGLAGGVVLPFLLVGLVVEARRWGRWRLNYRAWLAGFAVVTLLIVPQLILYRRYGGFTMDRYLLPAGLGMAAGVAAASVWSWRRAQHGIFLTATTVWVIMISVYGFSTWRDAEHFRVESVQLGRMLDLVSQAPANSTIAIAADPVRDLEAAVSLPFHIAARGRPDLDVRVLLTRSENPEAPAIVREFVTTYFPGRTNVNERDCSDLAAVVLFAPQSLAIEALPCLETAEFHLESFSENMRLPDFTPRILAELVPPVATNYSVLLK